MRRLAVTALLIVAGCRKSPPPSPPPLEAGAVGIVTVVPSAAASSAAVIEASAMPPPPPPLPVGADAFEIVAKGKPSSKLIWLQVHGSRVWLSARNLDAFADGDAPLAKGPDPLEKLPYTPGKHHLQVVGVHPHLFTLRTSVTPAHFGTADPTVFIRAADGTWTESKPIKPAVHPHAFVAYRDGAIFMTSELQINGSPAYFEGTQGTSLLFIAPDGTVSDPRLGVHAHFQAWGGAGDGETLALLGTIAVKAKAAKPGEPKFDEIGVHLLQLDRGGAQKTGALQRAKMPDFNLGPYQLKLHVHGGKTVVVPPHDVEGLTSWRPNIRTVSIVDANGKVTLRAVPGDEMCFVPDAELAGDVVYALRQCLTAESIYPELVRVDASGKTTRVKLPPDCQPESLLVREPDDVWLVATCAQAPTIFRRGRAQTPIELP